MKNLILTGALVLSLAATAQATSYSYTSAVNTAIPDGNLAGIMLSTNLSGLSVNAITNVNVRLQLTNGFNGDLHAYLVLRSADGSTTKAILLNRVGRTTATDFGYATAGLNVTLSSDTNSGYVDIHGVSSPTVGGTYLADGRTNNPTSSFLGVTNGPRRLDGFNNHNANGTWTLFLADVAGGDQSKLVSWGLDIGVVLVGTTTTVSSDNNPSTYGGSVTFTATVKTNSIAAGNAVGNMVFKVDGAPVATNVVASGLASYTTSTLSATSHSITAEYAGDINYGASTNTLSQTVNPATLTVTPLGSFKYYDGTTLNNAVYSDTLANYTITGLTNGDTTAVLSLSGAMAFNGSPTTVVRNAGGYALAQGTLAMTATNYTLTFANPTPNGYLIGQRPLTVTAVTDTKLYDGTTSSAGTPTVSAALQVGDATNTLSQAYANKHVGSGNKTLVPSIVITDGNSGNNYNVSLVNFTTGTISQTNLTVTASANRKVYDGNPSAVTNAAITAGNIQSGDSAPTWTQSYDNKNVGSGKLLTPATLAVTDGNSGNDYNVTFTAANVGEITAAPSVVTLAVNNPTVTYDGTGQAATVSLTSSNTAGSVTSVLTGGQALQTNAGTYGVTATFEPTDTNYTTLTGQATTNSFTINPATTTITPDTVTNFLYNATAQTPTNGISSLSTGAWSTNYVGVDVVYSSASAPTNAGTYGLTNAVVGDSNVVGATNGLLFTISVTNVTITAAANVKPYDGTASAAAVPTVTAGSIQAGEVATLTEAYTTTNAGTGLTLVPAVLSLTNAAGADVSGNYGITLVNSTAGEIDAVNATFTVTPYSVTYDGSGHTATVSTITGVNGETGATVGSVTLNTTHTNAGIYSSDSWSFAATGNYNSMGSTPITNTIGVKAASVTADAKTKIYGAVNPVLTAVTNGAVNGDVINVTISTLATQYSAVGVSNILVAAGSNPNYTVLTTNSTLTINAASNYLALAAVPGPTVGYHDSVYYTATVETNGATAPDASGPVVFYYSTYGTNAAVAFSTNYCVAGATNSLSITNLPRGTNLITAGYASFGNYLGGTNSLVQTVTNHPPVAGNIVVLRTPSQQVHIMLTNLASGWSDGDGDTLSLTNFDVTTTNAIHLLAVGFTNGVSIATTAANFSHFFIGYTNGPNVNDRFGYTISDGYGSASGYVYVLTNLADVFVTGQTGGIGYTNTSPVLHYYGIPGLTYVVQRSPDLVNWVDITNVTPLVGPFTVTDTNNPAAFYRLKYQP